MKVLLLNGSPHKNGTTNAVLNITAKILNEEGIETEIYSLGSNAISGCLGCAKCRSLGKCFMNDAVNDFVEKASKCDGFIFGAPVHYASINGNTSAFLDRVFYSQSGGRNNEVFRLKPASCVVVARRAGTTAAFDQLNKYLSISEMLIVSSRYWNNVHGATADDVLIDEEGIATLQVLAKNMAYTLKLIKAGEDAGVEKPTATPKVRTNFIR